MEILIETSKSGDIYSRCYIDDEKESDCEVNGDDSNLSNDQDFDPVCSEGG